MYTVQQKSKYEIGQGEDCGMVPLEVTTTYCCCSRLREIAFLLKREPAANASKEILQISEN